MADDGFISEMNPYLIEVEAGKTYFWCACGRSKRQPFCDGSHAGTEISPLRFTAERTEAVNLCGCKQTMDPPFCDGTHNVL
jgi:CDGSH-type Zn-finger protein